MVAMERRMRINPLLERRARREQRGLVLIFVLVALLILGIGSAALIRSFDTSTLTSANLGFKRDLTNEGQLAIAQAQAWFNDTAALGSVTVQQTNNASYNYYATIQDTDAHGIPNALLVTTPSSLLFTGGTAQLSGVTIYVMIDRLCFAGTVASTVAACTYAGYGNDKGGSSGLLKAGGGKSQVFRISVRVDGPHNTHAFMQQTVASPA